MATLRLNAHLADPQSATATVEIRPRRWAWTDLATLVRYRELLWFLALRDVQVRYKQTLLGALWAVAQPLAMMVVMSVLVGRMMGMADKTGGVPYPIFVFAGLLPWTFFAAAVNASTHSLVNSAAMLRKIYFPRLLTPLAATGAPLLDLMISLLVLGAMMAWYGLPPTVCLLWLPVLIALSVLASLAVGIGLSALTVQFRDFRYIVAFLLQIWFYLTPVIYPPAIAPEKLRWLLWLNPVSGTVEAFRAAVLGQALNYQALAISLGVSVGCLLASLGLFARAERHMADVV